MLQPVRLIQIDERARFSGPSADVDFVRAVTGALGLCAEIPTGGSAPDRIAVHVDRTVPHAAIFCRRIKRSVTNLPIRRRSVDIGPNSKAARDKDKRQ